MIVSSDAVNSSNAELAISSSAPHADRFRLGSKVQNGPVLDRQLNAQFNVQYVLKNDLTLVYPLVQELQNAVTSVYGEFNDSYRFQLEVSLDESLTNAIVHGNLEVSSETRKYESVYEQLIAARRLQKPYRDRHVYVDLMLDREQIMIRVRDEHPGFDVASVPDPAAPENLENESGRGLAMMHHFMDTVVHNASGNAVTMIKRAPCPPIH